MTDHESTWEQYELFRMADNCPTTTAWVEASSNPEYERHLMEMYNASMKGNSHG